MPLAYNVSCANATTVTSFNSTTNATANATASYNCTSAAGSATLRMLKSPLPARACAGGECDDRQCCDAFPATECNRSWYAQADRSGGDWSADECPSGYREITAVGDCQRAVDNLTAAAAGGDGRAVQVISGW